jgi:ketosteroid isomerase-like protein
MKTTLLKLDIKLILIGIGLTLIVACMKENNIDEELIRVDKDFAKYSSEHGASKAFYEYADENAVMLRDNAMPLLGRDHIQELFAKRDDSKYTFTWQPISAKTAKAGDMGFTYGTYKIITDDTVREGTYVSIWEKDKEGKWKFVLDSGNEGLGK